MRKLLANKVFILILVTLLIVAVIIFDKIPGSPVENITTPVSVIIDPVQKLVQGTGSKISDFFTAVSDGLSIRQENADLKKQIAELEYEVQQGKEAAIRWQELKDAFFIKDSFENYDIHGSSILTREADEWFSVIRIDVGSSNGIAISDINPSYAVVDAQMNLVGRIQSTDVSSSKVLPVLHEGFTVSAKVNTVNGAIVTVHGEVELKENGLCKVDQIPDQVSLQVGDVLVTSGDGGLFPAGIPVGVIMSVDNSSLLNRYATLKPYVDISSLKDVFIMVPKTQTAAAVTLTPTPAA
ncbi:MAG: rod shape-determining protein MreC [Eubacteriales bacterium]